MIGLGALFLVVGWFPLTPPTFPLATFPPLPSSNFLVSRLVKDQIIFLLVFVGLSVNGPQISRVVGRRYVSPQILCWPYQTVERKPAPSCLLVLLTECCDQVGRQEGGPSFLIRIPDPRPPRN